MKKIFTFKAIIALFFLLATTTNSYSQEERRVKFGFDLGLGYANQWGNAYDAYHKTGLFSFNFGVDIDVSVAEKQFVEIGLNFNRKGCKIEGHEWVKDGGPWGLYTEGDKTSINMFYLQLPVMYGVALPIADDISWKIMVGPYFAIGLAGDRRSDFDSDESQLHVLGEGVGLSRPKTESTFNDSPRDYTFKRFDIGAKIQTGVTVKRISYMIAYELGFFNTIKDELGYDYKARNNSIMLIVSFRF